MQGTLTMEYKKIETTSEHILFNRIPATAPKQPLTATRTLYFSRHKKRHDLREPAGLDLRCLDVTVLICVHEKGSGNNALSPGGL